MKRIKRLLLCIICSLLLTGCSLLEDNSMDDITVYTTIYPYNYLINYLYGNNSEVNSIYPTSVDLKKYKISDKKIYEYSKSDLFVFSSLDKKEREIAAKMVNNNKELKLIDVSMGMSINNNEELWLNPYNYLMMAKNVKDGLNEYIDNKLLNDSINKSYEELQYEISNLDATIKEMLENANYNIIIADNNSLKFLEKYGLKILILEDDVDEIKKLINENKVKYLYTFNQNNDEDLNSFITENNIELIVLNSMESVDGLISSANDNYFSIMNENIELINKELEK